MTEIHLFTKFFHKKPRRLPEFVYFPTAWKCASSFTTINLHDSEHKLRARTGSCNSGVTINFHLPNETSAEDEVWFVYDKNNQTRFS